MKSLRPLLLFILGLNFGLTLVRWCQFYGYDTIAHTTRAEQYANCTISSLCLSIIFLVWALSK